MLILFSYQEDSLDPTFVAIDANFRLCRRAKAASSSTDNDPLIQPSLFLSQNEVDQYVNSTPSLALKVSHFCFPIHYVIKSTEPSSISLYVHRIPAVTSKQVMLYDRTHTMLV